MLNMEKIVLLAAFMLASASSYAGFDWGGSECSGSGTFQQQISQAATVEVGVIPVNKEGVEIQLRASADVDIQLEDSASGQKIIHWPDGILSGADQQTTTYYGVSIEYSGYNGDGTGVGNEYIKITGATDRALVMKAYGYAAGYADISYAWTGTVGCSSGPAASGAGSFEQYIAEGTTLTIGDLVSGLSNVYITLASSSDVDVQLIDKSNGTKLVQWPDGLLNSETTSSTAYNGMTITYSGYGGNGTGPGNEYIQITGTLNTDLTMQAYGYSAGNATVTYSWGADNGGGNSGNNGNNGGSDQWDSYYADALGKTGTALKTALNGIIKGHTTVSYSTVWDALKETDEDPNNSNNVILLYKQTSQAKNTNGGSVDDWNREHVWAKSHGDFGTSRGPGTDLHHLRPTDVTVNSSRGNKDFDMGGSVVSEAPLCKTDSDSWEPPDEVKGDVARMIFYMAVRYEGNDGYPDLEVVNYSTTGSKNPVHGKLSTLKQWHQQDPVSDFERQRNDKIYTNWQSNRNPFIDRPEWVEAIW